MAEQPSVSIIVLNWNGFDDTVRCFTSLRALDYPSFRIVLVDNGSEHDEGKRLAEMFPEVHLIANRTNRGFAGGNNDGMRWALESGAAYIVTLNNDCVVEPNWLSALVQGVQSAGADFGSSRIMLDPDRHLVGSDGDVLLADGSALAENRNLPFGGGPIKPIFGACGAASLFSAECLKSTALAGPQYFDEMYFAYYEDADLALRLRAKDFKGVMVPDAVVYHKQSQTAGAYSFFKTFLSEKNRILNMLLNYPAWLIPLGELFFVLRQILLAVHAVFSRTGKGSRYMKHTGPLKALAGILRARVWVLVHLGEAWRNRAARKRSGLMPRRVYRIFYWRIGRMLA
ncbi:MAG: glycosyltransferase family 2 protein [Kiritimatiellae bacterium]|nr:glycosyltransferase family 2 protein [Kiritimatiellia bacterium]